jgi:hypothetical protein
MRRRYWIALAVFALAIVGVGSALAATKLESPGARNQAIIDDAAGRLHVSPQQLSSALRQALADQVDAAVAAGRLTKAQGNALKARIDSGKTRLVGGFPFAFGLGFRAFGGPHHRLAFPFPLAPGRVLATGLRVLTSYLGITPAQLRTELAAGKSLAQIAKDHGKTADGLVAALIAAAKTRLDHAVTSKYLTSAQEKAILGRLQAFFEMLVQRTPPPIAHFGFAREFRLGRGLLHPGPFRRVPGGPFWRERKGWRSRLVPPRGT